LPLADSWDGTVYLALDPLRVVAFTTAEPSMRDGSHASCGFVERVGARELARAHANRDAVVRRHLQRQLQAGRGLKGTMRPYSGPSDEPFLVRQTPSMKWRRSAERP